MDTFMGVFFLFGSGFTGYHAFTFLFRKDDVWQNYLRRQETRGFTRDAFKRTDEWDNNTHLWGVIFAFLAFVELLASLSMLM